MPVIQKMFFLGHKLLFCSVFFITHEAGAKPKAKGYAEPGPWDWQKAPSNYPVFSPYPTTYKVTQPEFLPVPRNMSVDSGDTAYLPCRVKNLAEHYTVSWIRARDVTVLSVGHLTFSSDQRFSVIQVPRPRLAASDWTLVINNTSRQDEGVYECQVNTDPKINRKNYLTVKDPISNFAAQKDSPYKYSVDDPNSDFQKTHSVIKKHHAKGSVESEQGFSMFLHENGCLCPKPQFKKHKDFVIDRLNRGPKLVITGGPVQYVSHGGGIGLECLLSGMESPPGKIFWRKGDQVVTAKQRPGLSLETERLSGTSRSHLYIANTKLSDTGNYTCVSDSAKSQTVLLVVTVGYDHTSRGLLGAALQNSSMSQSPVLSLLLFTLMFCFLFPARTCD